MAPAPVKEGRGQVVDPRFRGHDPGRGHPERPERLAVLERLFDTPALRDLRRVEPRHAGEEELGRVHVASHLEAVAASAGQPYTRFDADTPACADSFEAATLAAGAAMELADAICSGELDNGFAALRPPGHHAEASRPMGFCLFNNVAVAAQHLRHRHGLERVLVLDWDVHHGNGTQHSFYDDPSVMYVSLHQYPFYPGSGAASEIGQGAGAGYTVNVPMAAGSSNDDYSAAFRDLILPIARRFAPQFVLVSAGFDAHSDDPLASIDLNSDAFAEMTDAVSGLADECSGGKLMLLLEGGYDLDALAGSVERVLGRLLAPGPFAPAGGELSSQGREAARALRPHWESI